MTHPYPYTGGEVMGDIRTLVDVYTKAAHTAGSNGDGAAALHIDPEAGVKAVVAHLQEWMVTQASNAEESAEHWRNNFDNAQLQITDLSAEVEKLKLEILDWKEAVEIANAENDDLRREVAATTKHAQLLNKMLGEADARAERLRVALEKIVAAEYSGGAKTAIARKALEDDKQ